MRGIKLSLIGVLISLFFVSMAFAAEKLGYVDLSRLFDEYQKTKEYDQVLEKKQTSYESEREKLVNEIKRMQEGMNLLSDKQKQAKESDLERKVQELRDFDRDKTQDLRKERDEKMKDILKDIETAISQYAQKEKFTLVFNDRVLVYQDKSLDITQEVLAILKKNYKR